MAVALLLELLQRVIRCEDELEEVEEEIGNPGTTYTCCAESIYHAEIVEIANERAGSV